MTDHLPRKLAAILYADVAGYSRLMGQDEDRTHRRLSEYLDLVSDTIKTHHGNVVHYAGDAVLADFGTATNAVACASTIQHLIAERNQDVPEDQQVVFRIGVNLGEVIVDRDDIYGDGVNVAARLESLAESGGICISESVYTAVGSRLPFDYEDLGDKEVKNIKNPVRVYRVRLTEGAELPSPSRAVKSQPKVAWSSVAIAALVFVISGWVVWLGPWATPVQPEPIETSVTKVPTHISIVVLPLKNKSDQAEHTNLANAISEGITNGLSRFRGLFVISSDSANHYRELEKSPKEIARELKVRYVLSGSVRRSAERLRVTMELTDTDSESLIWSQQYDRVNTDVFVVQDEIVGSVVSTIGEELWQTAASKLASKPLENFAAYDYHLQALEALHKLTHASVLQARELSLKASALDTKFGAPYLIIAWTYYIEYTAQWTATGPESLDKAEIYLAQKAEKSGDDYNVFRLMANINQKRGHLDKAMAQIERALQLNPNHGDLLATYARILIAVGQSGKAQRWIDDAMQRNPHYPGWYASVLSSAQYLQKNYQGAIATLNKVGRLHIWDHRYLAASYAQLGQLNKATQHVQSAIENDPGFSLATYKTKVQFRLDADKDHFLDGLKKAGFPE
jgi:adenylate cyclase